VIATHQFGRSGVGGVVPDGATVADAVRAAALAGHDLILALTNVYLYGEAGTAVGSSPDAYMNVHFTLAQVLRMQDRLDAETTD
jgi:hypothetical protein